MKQFTSYQGQHCANCGTPMQGEFCHACGQSIHSVIKPIHGMLEDTMDIVFHLDGRVVHTIPPLLLRPGFLTLEYFSGRRVRYVAPFRLMFVLSLLAFFVIHLRMDAISQKVDSPNGFQILAASDEFKDADSPGEVRETLKNKLDDLAKARETGLVPTSALELDAKSYRQQANRRLIELAAVPMPAASLMAPLPIVAPAAGTMTPASADGTVREANDKTPDAEMHPIRVSWLPDMVNARLNRIAQHAHANWHAYRHGDTAAREEAKQRVISGFFGVLPPTMFVLMPIFALLLKLFYVFKRRLYVEHLIVALHSHAFLFLDLLLIMLDQLLTAWIKPHAAWMAAPLGLIDAVLWLWMPVYLLVMQKRVYRQGWPMTVLKYLFVGWCYGWLLLLALSTAFVLGLAH